MNRRMTVHVFMDKHTSLGLKSKLCIHINIFIKVCKNNPLEAIVIYHVFCFLPSPLL